MLARAPVAPQSIYGIAQVVRKLRRNRWTIGRQVRYVMLAKVANKDTQTVVSTLIKQAKTLPNELYKSLTWDGIVTS